MTLSSLYASVVLDLAVDKPLDYSIPLSLADKIKKGMRVAVPLRGKIQKGYVLEVKGQPSFLRVLPIKDLISDEEVINEELFDLALWMARYYCSSLSQIFKVMLPGIIRKDTKHKQQLFVMRAKTREELRTICEELRNPHPGQAEILDVMLNVTKGILLSELLEKTQGSRSPVDTLAKKGCLILDIVRVDRSPLMNEEYFKTKPKSLNEEQSEALRKIKETQANGEFGTHLLYGITGSGKTEVYLQAIENTLSSGLGSIMLVPEIALTTQMIERFRSRFDNRIAVLHHRLSGGERFDEWHRIRRGEAPIVIGARSAIFSPIPNLGLIIVDEEHEQSYKQSEESPCYHARDVAVMRAKFSKCPIILGSATPSIESYYNAQIGKYQLSVLSKRADAASLPKVIIVDMKKEYEKIKGYTNFSEALLSGIQQRQALGEQTILFLNRRGYHTSLVCQQCGVCVKCSQCDTSLTFHKGDNHLSCHLCGYQVSPPPQQCPTCKNGNTMKYRGVGTEQIEKALHAIFPEIRTLRIDADTTRHKGSHQRLLRDFGSGKADVVIGTQMIAKGLHFPQVTLVGVLNCDSSLNIPDFRASEVVFQLITQVSGRAGRGSTKGEVVIQTCIPDNQTIHLASEHDYQTFYNEEIVVRETFHYPPFVRLAKIAFSGAQESQVLHYAEAVRGHLMISLPQDCELLPVVPSGHAKVKGQYRHQFLIKSQNIYVLNEKIRAVLAKLKYLDLSN